VETVLNNRYRLEKKIGEGGFAKVYLATDIELERPVAVKVLEQSWANDPEFLGRFRKEARAIAALDHPNILLIHDFGVANGVPYLVMPYISGGTFAQRMRQTRLTLDEIAFYLEQIGSALDYAHQQGVIHRDIKPTNMLLKPNGQLVLTDFGLAKLISNAAVEERTGVLGTVAYMAPEQFQGLVSSASDIYALGILLYQVIAGKLPYDGNTREILIGHVRQQPKPLVGTPAMQQYDSVVVAALDQVVARVLAKRPADRYPSCQALTYAFRQAIRPGQRGSGIDQEETEKEKQGGPHQVPPPPVYVRPVVNQPPVVKSQLSQSNQDATEIAPPLQREVVRPKPAVPPGYLEKTEIAPPQAPVRRQVMLKPAHLTVTTEPDQGFRATFELTGDTLTLGREPDNNLCLPLAIVSRHHAFLYRVGNSPQGSQYKIVDRKSVNHLYFKNREVPEKILENGDIIEIGVRGYGQYIVQLTYQAPVFGYE
jgi:serine/threonine-protein kinase